MQESRANHLHFFQSIPADSLGFDWDESTIFSVYADNNLLIMRHREYFCSNKNTIRRNHGDKVLQDIQSLFHQHLTLCRFKSFDHGCFMNNWFTVDGVDPDTCILSEYRHREETHCYLLNGSDYSLLIDTGLGICNIHEQMMKLTNKPVIAIFLTSMLMRMN
jgi:hypothetical protein